MADPQTRLFTRREVNELHGEPRITSDHVHAATTRLKTMGSASGAQVEAMFREVFSLDDPLGIGLSHKAA